MMEVQYRSEHPRTPAPDVYAGEFNSYYLDVRATDPDGVWTPNARFRSRKLFGPWQSKHWNQRPGPFAAKYNRKPPRLIRTRHIQSRDHGGNYSNSTFNSQTTSVIVYDPTSTPSPATSPRIGTTTATATATTSAGTIPTISPTTAPSGTTPTVTATEIIKREQSRPVTQRCHAVERHRRRRLRRQPVRQQPRPLTQRSDPMAGRTVATTTPTATTPTPSPTMPRSGRTPTATLRRQRQRQQRRRLHQRRHAVGGR